MKKFIRDLNKPIDKLGGNIYLVGGYIRDKLINPKSEPQDADFIYDGNIESLVKVLNEGEYNFMPLKISEGIYRNFDSGNIIDISRIKGDSIEEDLHKRDFTINAVCMKLGENKIIDPFQGRKAIKNRIIKVVSSNSLEEDPVRILRAIRIYIGHGMHFNYDTERLIVKSAAKLKNAVKERVFSEIMLIIKEDKQGKAFEIMDDYSILQQLFPYISELKTIGKCKYHVEDVFTHMNLTYQAFKDIVYNKMNIKNLDMNILNLKIADFSMAEYTALACFLHDIGKYETYQNTNGKISFIGHDKKGGEICAKLCSDLKFPAKALKFIKDMVNAHMYPLMIFKNGVKDKRKNLYKFFSRYNRIIPYILVLSFCDNYATTMLLDEENQKESYKNFIENIFKEYNRYLYIKNNRIINGNDIMSILKVKGPIIGKIMDNVDFMRYLKNINTKEEIVSYIMNMYT